MYACVCRCHSIGTPSVANVFGSPTTTTPQPQVSPYLFSYIGTLQIHYADKVKLNYPELTCCRTRNLCIVIARPKSVGNLKLSINIT